MLETAQIRAAMEQNQDGECDVPSNFESPEAS
jgi:hypothetical protein